MWEQKHHNEYTLELGIMGGQCAVTFEKDWWTSWINMYCLGSYQDLEEAKLRCLEEVEVQLQKIEEILNEVGNL